VIFHSDAVQAVGKVPIDVNKTTSMSLSITGHKIYGPKGAGALYVRRKNPRVQIAAQIDGGGHERGMRSGTLNVPGIAGLGKACEIAQEGDAAGILQNCRPARPAERQAHEAALDEVHVNGSMEHRLPGNLNISFAYVEGESLLMGINDIAVSSGSACTSATLEPSYVLKALGTGRRSGAQLDSLRHRAIQHRGRSRLRRRPVVDVVCVCANSRRSTKWRKRVWT
jgi:cysteine desulfurase